MKTAFIFIILLATTAAHAQTISPQLYQLAQQEEFEDSASSLCLSNDDLTALVKKAGGAQADIDRRLEQKVKLRERYEKDLVAIPAATAILQKNKDVSISDLETVLSKDESSQVILNSLECDSLDGIFGAIIRLRYLLTCVDDTGKNVDLLSLAQDCVEFVGAVDALPRTPSK